MTQPEPIIAASEAIRFPRLYVAIKYERLNAIGVLRASRRTTVIPSSASIGMMREPMPRGYRLSRRKITGCCRRPSANTSLEQDQLHRSGGAPRFQPTKLTTMATSHMAAVQRASGAGRQFQSIVSTPIRGDYTMCTAMSGNGRRIAGMKKMPVIRGTASQGQLETAAFALCAALPSTIFLTRFARPGAKGNLSAVA
jgi:hypothetical protein